MYLFFIPETNNMNIKDIINAKAVPQSGCFIISKIGTKATNNISPNFSGLLVSSLPFNCIFVITNVINSTNAILANSAGCTVNFPMLNQLEAPFIGSVNNTPIKNIRDAPYNTGDILINIS